MENTEDNHINQDGSEERRISLRLQYRNQAVVVMCDTMDKYTVKTHNVSPFGMCLSFPADTKDILGRDMIIVTQTLIMYATVVRMVKRENEVEAGVQARKFSPEVLEYLFESIGGEERIAD